MGIARHSLQGGARGRNTSAVRLTSLISLIAPARRMEYLPKRALTKSRKAPARLVLGTRGMARATTAHAGSLSATLASGAECGRSGRRTRPDGVATASSTPPREELLGILRMHFVRPVQTTACPDHGQLRPRPAETASWHPASLRLGADGACAGDFGQDLPIRHREVLAPGPPLRLPHVMSPLSFAEILVPGF